jgi:hypothetical protein
LRSMILLRRVPGGTVLMSTAGAAVTKTITDTRVVRIALSCIVGGRGWIECRLFVG